jgi:hypothetical protein
VGAQAVREVAAEVVTDVAHPAMVAIAIDANID